MQEKEPERYAPEIKEGLSSAQVEQRQAQGLTNEFKTTHTKTYGQIFKDNLFTFFNILNLVMAVLLISVSAYKDLMFVLIVAANLVIGIVQEISSKRTLDALSLIVAAKACVVRNGKKETIEVSEVVLDDIVFLKLGDQICADAEVKDGYIEVNESLITGEADAQNKKSGDFLYSGSYVVSGSAYAQAVRVGEENYANQIAGNVKTVKKRNSELDRSLNRILKGVSAIIAPLGILLFLKHYLVLDLSAADSIVKTVAAVIGMIPEGLILLTSVALATSAIILAVKRRTLVQDLYCTETLARVDTLCLDKTGTLTTGEISVSKVVPLGPRENELQEIIRDFLGVFEEGNQTTDALKEYFGEGGGLQAVYKTHFSSSRKYSSVAFEGRGTYVLGAAEFIFPEGKEEQIKQNIDALSKEGSRTLVLAHSSLEQEGLPGDIKPIAMILMTDKLRSEAKDTLAYFAEQGVQIKIISGDNPYTVANAARGAGFSGNDIFIDASKIGSEEEVADVALKHDIFGRVSPEQKKQMIGALKKAGRTVAMMGDGVNDVMALKEADCGIAVAEGSDAAKNIADVVLLDSNFDALPGILNEGRKVINNVQRVATLFITKTVYSLLLAVATLLFFENGYPFTPLHMFFMSVIMIGIPSFVLALEPNYSRIEGRFIENVLRKSIPGGLCIFLCILLVNLVGGAVDLDGGTISTMSIILVTAAGLIVVYKVSVPFTTMRKILLISMVVLFVFCMTVLRKLLDVAPIAPINVVVSLVIVAALPFLMRFFEIVCAKYFAWLEDRRRRKEKITIVIPKR